MKIDNTHELQRLFESIVQNDPDTVASDEVTEGYTSQYGDDIDDNSDSENMENNIVIKLCKKYGNVNFKSLIYTIAQMMNYMDNHTLDDMLHNRYIVNADLLADLREYKINGYGMNAHGKFSNRTPGTDFSDVEKFHNVAEDEEPVKKPVDEPEADKPTQDGEEDKKNGKDTPNDGEEVMSAVEYFSKK